MKKSSDFEDGVKVEIDAYLVIALDTYRHNCPTINRSALVNTIILDWAQEQRIRMHQSRS